MSLAPHVQVSRVPGGETPLEIHESARAAGCYEFVTELWFVDERVAEHYVKEIREAIPRYVPLMCRRIFRNPQGSEERFDYHVTGMYIPYPNEGHEDSYIRLAYVPRGFPFPADKIQPLRTFAAEWEKGSLESNQAKPAIPIPFGPWVVEQLKSTQKFFQGAIQINGGHVSQGDFVKDKLRAILTAESKRDDEMCEKARAEARYRVRHNWKQLKDAIDNERWQSEPPPARTSVFLKG